MKFMRRAKRTRFVLLNVFGVDGSICRPEPPAPPELEPFPLPPNIEEKPFRLRICILVPGDADAVNTTLVLSEFDNCL